MADAPWARRTGSGRRAALRNPSPPQGGAQVTGQDGGGRGGAAVPDGPAGRAAGAHPLLRCAGRRRHRAGGVHLPPAAGGLPAPRQGVARALPPQVGSAGRGAGGVGRALSAGRASHCGLRPSRGPARHTAGLRGAPARPSGLVCCFGARFPPQAAVGCCLIV